MATTFDNILGKLKNVLFEGQTPPAASTTNAAPVAATPVTNTTSASNVAASGTMVQKVHELLDKMNAPGIDFMELWDATSAMGALSEQNVSNAFLALKVASGNTLSKQHIISSGNNYATQLRTALEQDVQQKLQMKQNHLQQKQSSLTSLQQEVDGIKQQIAALQSTLNDKEQQLAQLNSANDSTVQDIDRKVAEGEAAVQVVLGEIAQLLSLADKAIPA
ncbi:MAG: hypothetical protein RL660_875 [Bacteroidota bacterium]|jgi:hypothetical protein